MLQMITLINYFTNSERSEGSPHGSVDILWLGCHPEHKGVILKGCEKITSPQG